MSIFPKDALVFLGDHAKRAHDKFIYYILSLLGFLRLPNTLPFPTNFFLIDLIDMLEIYSKVHNIFENYTKKEDVFVYDLLHSEIIYLGGYINYLNNYFEIALNFFKEFYNYDKQSITAIDYLISINSENLREYNKAKNIAENHLDDFPSFLKYRIFYLIGNTYIRLSEKHKLDNDQYRYFLNQAKKYYEKVLLINKYHMYALNNLLVCYSKLGEYNKAINIFEKTNEVCKYNPKAWFNYGLALLKQRKIEKCVNAFFNAKKLDPNYKKVDLLLKELEIQLRKRNGLEKSVRKDKSNKEKLISFLKRAVDILLDSVIETILGKFFDSYL
ncbi:MAG: tetratricopeptide repeat protein [Candidatus Asgardarchaeia archaeon]